MQEESLFWADQIARAAEERVNKEPILKKLVRDRGYIVYDEKTPSGTIHIGAGRGWIIHDAIAKAMRDYGLKAKFILSSDDIDPFDKMPSYLDKEYEQYLGMPFRDIPSPVKGYENYADYYFSECTEKFDEFGVEAELQRTGDRYDDGSFNNSIKIALDNSDKIQKIYERIYKKSIGTEKLPFNPICEKCGRIGSTLAYEWDSERESVKYKCTSDLVPWAKGCGHKGEISPYNGNGKLPWKVEWAAKWPTVGVVYEIAGKDHFTYGGSRTVSIAICSEVFDFPPPLPSSKTESGVGYEFFNIQGKKMSTSKGRGIGFVEITNYMPANLLRFLMVKTKPSKHIDFDPNGYTIPLLYDEFDKYERLFFGTEKEENEKKLQHIKRIYTLSQVNKVPENLPVQIPFSTISTVVQATHDKDYVQRSLEKLKAMNYFVKLSEYEEKIITNKINFAKNWVEKFAPDDMKISFLENTDEAEKGLSKEAISALIDISKLLEKKDWTEDTLQKEIFTIIKSKNQKPGDVFSAAYKCLIGKEKGPRLSSLILALGSERVSKRFKELP